MVSLSSSQHHKKCLLINVGTFCLGNGFTINEKEKQIVREKSHKIQTTVF